MINVLLIGDIAFINNRAYRRVASSSSICVGCCLSSSNNRRCIVLTNELGLSIGLCNSHDLLKSGEGYIYPNGLNYPIRRCNILVKNSNKTSDNINYIIEDCLISDLHLSLFKLSIILKFYENNIQ